MQRMLIAVRGSKEMPRRKELDKVRGTDAIPRSSWRVLVESGMVNHERPSSTLAQDTQYLALPRYSTCSLSNS